MNIGMVCYSFMGGSGIVATELGHLLAEKGHQVHFIAFEQPYRLNLTKPNIFFHRIEQRQYPHFKADFCTLAMSSKIVEIARLHQLDIIHAHYAIPHAICAFMSKKILESTIEHVPKLITTLHGTDITILGSNQEYYDLTRFSMMNSDGLTAVSHYLAEQTMSRFQINQEIKVIHNFIDTARFKPTLVDARAYFSESNAFLIGHVSNFRPVKRIMDVIDIFKRIDEQVSAKLLLIGDGPELDKAKKDVMQKKLTEKVLFLGNQRHVENILPSLDLMLMPSEEESFGLAALESLGCGVPVIGTLKTGLPEVILDGVNGFLCTIGDCASMSDKSINLLKDLSRLNQFKKNAHKHSHECFNAQRLVTEYEQYYIKVLNG